MTAKIISSGRNLIYTGVLQFIGQANLPGLKKIVFTGFLFLFIFIAPDVSGQISNAVSRDAERPSAFGGGVGYGELLNRNAWMWGVSIDWSRRLKNNNFGIAASIMFDNETKRKSDDPSVGSFTSALAASYLLNHMFSVGTGLAKGFINNENSSQNYGFDDGDWSTGAFLVIQPERIPFSISIIYEYNLSEHDNSITLDLGFVLPF